MGLLEFCSLRMLFIPKSAAFGENHEAGPELEAQNLIINFSDL